MDNERLNVISGKILDSAIEVHRYFGPGLLESIYETCLCKEFDLSSIKYERQVPVPLIYKSLKLSKDLKLDILVEDSIIIDIIELKSAQTEHPFLTAQLLRHLKLSNKKSGLLINFNVPGLIDGFKRIIN